MTVLGGSSILCIRRRTTVRAMPSAGRLGVALFLAALIITLFVRAAQAQTDEPPTITISAPATVTKGEEIEFTFEASSAPAKDVVVKFQFTLQGPSVHETGPGHTNLSADETLTWIHVDTVKGSIDLTGKTVTVTILPGDGYVVGSPSTASARVLALPEIQEPTPTPSAPQATPTPETQEPTPTPPAPQATPSLDPVIGSTSTATATVLSGDRLVIRRHDLSNDQSGDESSDTLALKIGWVSMDGSWVILRGVIRDQSRGQTYGIVRHEVVDRVVRRWIAPTSPLIHAIDWDTVNTQFTVPTSVLLAVPLDDLLPEPNMLARRFDGGDDRIFAYDATQQQWRSYQTGRPSRQWASTGATLPPQTQASSTASPPAHRIRPPVSRPGTTTQVALPAKETLIL